ncbi:enoyl-CoA hydratase-related protein [Kistimonas scapharcae]|uniref:Enoyl-CoA hydratase-related protein n=1 Tax=Kistimonas scapharcae TaxID=1036133 RepID=A0ABP8V608_9GAMM
MSDSEKTILHTLDKRGVARLTFNRPEKRNAFDDRMIDAINHQLDQWLTDGAVRVLIIDAAGGNFSAGADLGWMKRTASLSLEDNLSDAKALASLMQRIDTFPCPVISLVNGAAYGGSLGIIAASDMAFCASDASFCLSEVKIGLIPAVISPYVIRAIGERSARRYMLTAEVIDASQACQLGLAHAIDDDLEAVAENLITRVLNNGPSAMAACKSLIQAVSSQALDEQLIADTSARIARIRTSDEGQEGLQAFLEKRRPAWIKEQP